MIAFASLLLIAQAGAVEAPPNPDWNCDDPLAQQEMNWCAYQDYLAADAALNAQWAEAVAAMKAADAEVDPEFDDQPGYYETLLESQRAWLRFRDAHCLLYSFEARGGSMQPMLDSGCKASLTEARTRELRELVLGPEGE